MNQFCECKTIQFIGVWVIYLIRYEVIKNVMTRPKSTVWPISRQVYSRWRHHCSVEIPLLIPPHVLTPPSLGAPYEVVRDNVVCNRAKPYVLICSQKPKNSPMSTQSISNILMKHCINQSFWRLKSMNIDGQIWTW